MPQGKMKMSDLIIDYCASLIEKFILPLASTPMYLTFTVSPSASLSSTLSILSFAILEMCTRPSLPGTYSTKAPNSLMPVTVPV